VDKTKPFDISKQLVWDAYRHVRANRGAAGVDGQSLAMFEEDLQGQLYKVWNRMSSGSYFPPPVRLAEIPKRGKGGGKRPLGIPTVSDRVAQTVARMVLEPEVEPMFHVDSYGARPGKSALDAVGVARERCWRRDWVIDLDIRSFFDSLDHDLLLRAVRHHTAHRWIPLYVKRWLCAPVQGIDGSCAERICGVPQGGPLSPLLANLFMHYAFDAWMEREFPHIWFERYLDDVVVHCATEEEARKVLSAIEGRLGECGLDLHPEKTKVVYCQDSNRSGKYPDVHFDFLGYRFQPRPARSRRGKFFFSFLPAVSPSAANRIRATIRGWRIPRWWSNRRLEDLAVLTDPSIRGWINYYGRFYRSELLKVLQYVNEVLVRWARSKYRRFRRKPRQARHWLGRIARRDPQMLALWQLDVRPAAGR
jgi:group II intron reverse transcriptase/maturase